MNSIGRKERRKLKEKQNNFENKRWKGKGRLKSIYRHKERKVRNLNVWGTGIKKSNIRKEGFVREGVAFNSNHISIKAIMRNQRVHANDWITPN